MPTLSNSEISKYNLIDEFLSEIDKVKGQKELDHIVRTYITNEDTETDDWSVLETLLICLDRVTQDVEESESDVSILEIVFTINDRFLQNGIEYLRRYSANITLLNYIINIWISILLQRSKLSNLDFQRCMLFFDKNIYESSSSYFEEHFIDHDLPRLIAKGNDQGLSVYEFKSFLDFVSKYFPGMKDEKRYYQVFDQQVLVDDIFNFEDSRISLIELEHSVSDTITTLSKFDINGVVNSILNFDDHLSNSLWTISIRIHNYNDIYYANRVLRNLSFLVDALESIDEIDIYIEELRKGSLVFKFIARVKSLSSEIDFKSVLHQAVLFADALINKKSLTEIRKVDAERVKLQTEAKKIEVETSSLDPTIAKELSRLDLVEKRLNLRKLEQEILLREEDVRQKKLDTVKKISEVIGKGIFELDSDVQIEINNMIYFDFDKQANSLKIGDIEIIDAQKKIEPKIHPGNEGVDVG